MSQTLLLQVSVGNTYGYVYRKEESPQALAAAKEFENACMPSVRRYCEKHGYDYQLITEYPTDIDILFFNKSTKGTDYDYSGGGKNKKKGGCDCIGYHNRKDCNQKGGCKIC